jgi:hypothetical protein
MLSLDSPRWRTLLGGYRMPYDASIALRRMEHGAVVWDELWENLHHQGDVGEASYAAVPQLVSFSTRLTTDWNLYALAATIEVERHRTTNPPLPDWLTASYRAAWEQLAALALRDLAGAPDPLLLKSALSVVALARGEVKLGAILAYMDNSEIAEYADEHLAWSTLYT